MTTLKNRVFDIKRNDTRIVTHFSVENKEFLVDEMDTLEVGIFIETLIEKKVIPENVETGLLIVYSDNDYLVKL
jgi:hypothetical protein